MAPTGLPPRHAVSSPAVSDRQLESLDTADSIEPAAADDEDGARPIRRLPLAEEIPPRPVTRGLLRNPSLRLPSGSVPFFGSTHMSSTPDSQGFPGSLFVKTAGEASAALRPQLPSGSRSDALTSAASFRGLSSSNGAVRPEGGFPTKLPPATSGPPSALKLPDMSAIFAAIQMQEEAEERERQAQEEAAQHHEEKSGDVSGDLLANAESSAKEARLLADAAMTVAAAALPSMLGKAPPKPKAQARPPNDGLLSMDYASGIGLGLGGGLIVRTRRFRDAQPEADSTNAAGDVASSESGAVLEGDATLREPADDDIAGNSAADRVRLKLERARQRQQADLEEAADDFEAAGGTGAEDADLFKSLARLAATCGLSAAELRQALERRRADGSSGGAGSALAWARTYRQRLTAQIASLERILVAEKSEASPVSPADMERMRVELPRLQKLVAALRAWEDDERLRRGALRQELQLAQAEQAAREAAELEARKARIAEERARSELQAAKRKAGLQGEKQREAELLRMQMEKEKEAALRADRAKEEERLARVRQRQQQERHARTGPKAGRGKPA